MKKLLCVLILSLLWHGSVNAKIIRDQLRTGEVYENEIIWSSKIKIALPPGKWTVIEKWTWSYNALRAREAVLVQLEGNLINRLVDIWEFDGGGKWMAYIQDWMQEVYFADDHDGCYKRPEYTVLERYKRGATFNCFRVAVWDMQKELYNPDDKTKKTYSAIIRKWIRKNDIKVPPIMLGSSHYFFAPAVKDTLTGVLYLMNPELNGASKSQFTTEETSEYYPGNINKYPDKKKFMEKWIKLAAQRHKVFEKGVNAKPRHELDLSKYGVEEPVEEKTETKETKKTIEKINNDIVQQLKDLEELYKSGALTKEEYTKAKKKLLN